MKNLVQALLGCFVLCSSLSCQPRPAKGLWKGQMTAFGKSVDLTLELEGKRGTLSSQAMELAQVPLSDIQWRGDQLRFAWVTDTRLQFEARVKGDRIAGRIRVPDMPQGMEMAFSVDRALPSSTPRPFDEVPLSIQSRGATLAATLLVPKALGPHPGIVLLHGSGTGNRAELRFEGEWFAHRGFQVLLADKRGWGQSTGNRASVSLQDRVQDAIACLDALQHRPRVDPRRLGLWGTSQGATLLPWIAEQSTLPTFLIAVAPEIFGITEGAIWDDQHRVARAGGTPEQLEAVKQAHRTVEDMIRQGRSHEEVEGFIQSHASRHPFMNQTGLHRAVQISAEAFRGWVWQGRTQKFDGHWKRVRVPTLALFGQEDDILDAVKNEATLRGFARPQVTTRMIPGAGHNLRKAFQPSDMDFTRSLPIVWDTVEAWLKATLPDPQREAGTKPSSDP